nr:hypothetical protein MtrunA17_Chr6g0461201 [Ipomoea batatas]
MRVSLTSPCGSIDGARGLTVKIRAMPNANLVFPKLRVRLPVTVFAPTPGRDPHMQNAISYYEMRISQMSCLPLQRQHSIPPNGEMCSWRIKSRARVHLPILNGCWQELRIGLVGFDRHQHLEENKYRASRIMKYCRCSVDEGVLLGSERVVEKLTPWVGATAKIVFRRIDIGESGNQAATSASIDETYGSTTSGRPEMMTTTHFTDPQTLLMTSGPGSAISSVGLSPAISAYGGSPTTTIA